MGRTEWQDFALLLLWIAPAALVTGRLIQQLWLRQKQAVKKSKLDGREQWGIYTPIAIVVVTYYLFGYIFAPLFFGVLYSLLFTGSAPAIETWFDEAYVGFCYSLLVTCLQLGVVFWFMQRRGGTLQTLGLNRPHWKYLGHAVAGFILYFLVFLVAVRFIEVYIPEINTEQEQQLGFQSVAGFEYLLVYMALVIIPAFGEEILMRGFLYQSLKKRLPNTWAVIVTSMLFAVAHLQLGSGEIPLWIAAVDTFILSVALIKLVDYSNSLWPAIFVHLIKNSLAFIYLFVLAS